jgi:sugar phosphate isomerase/epimerase
MAGVPHIPAPPLAPTLAALGDDPRRAIDHLHELGFRHVQLSAAQPGLRPREMDRSARRDLLAMMRRREIEPAGIDLWIPPEHFEDATHVDRAVSAVVSAIEMAADLGRVPVSITLPARGEDASGVKEATGSVIAAAHRFGVPIADHAVPIAAREDDEFFGIGIDPAAWLASGTNPADVVSANAESLVAARLCDLSTAGMRVPIGDSGGGGRLDVEAYKVALSVAGYERPVVVDARQWLDAWRGVEQTRAAWR